MIRETRLWAISVLLGWCLNLTPQETASVPLIQAWIDAAYALKGMR